MASNYYRTSGNYNSNTTSWQQDNQGIGLSGKQNALIFNLHKHEAGACREGKF